MTSEVTVMPNMIMFFLITGLVSIIGVASKIFLGLSVYHDAKYKQNENATLWGVLSGIFFIAAVVYLIVAFTAPQKAEYCQNCGGFLPPDTTYCQSCGKVSAQQLETHKKRRKTFLILWIISIIITVIATVAIIATGLMGFVTQFSEYGEVIPDFGDKNFDFFD